MNAERGTLLFEQICSNRAGVARLFCLRANFQLFQIYGDFTQIMSIN
jgi:hypothetical protein